MGDSSMKMGTLATFVGDTANAPSVVNSNFSIVRLAFNDSLDTDSGHIHDGVDAKMVYGGSEGWNSEEMLLGMFIGVFPPKRF